MINFAISIPMPAGWNYKGSAGNVGAMVFLRQLQNEIEQYFYALSSSFNIRTLAYLLPAIATCSLGPFASYLHSQIHNWILRKIRPCPLWSNSYQSQVWSPCPLSADFVAEVGDWKTASDFG